MFSYKPALVTYAVAAALILFACMTAKAQTPSLATVVANCGTPPSTYTAGQQKPVLQNTSGLQCSAASVTSGGTLTVSAAPLTIVAGTQRALSIASATTLTIPATATVALIQAQGTNNTSGVCLYWQDDGTAPTASAGQQMAAQASMFYRVTSLPIQLIAATSATCTATISYYK